MKTAHGARFGVSMLAMVLLAAQLGCRGETSKAETRKEFDRPQRF
jgi:hypothetical protein